MRLNLTKPILSHTKNIMSKFVPIVVSHNNVGLTSVNYLSHGEIDFLFKMGKGYLIYISWW